MIVLLVHLFLQQSQRRTSSPAVFQREPQMSSHRLQQTEMTPSQHTEPAEVDYHQKPYTPGYSASVSYWTPLPIKQSNNSIANL